MRRLDELLEDPSRYRDGLIAFWSGHFSRQAIAGKWFDAVARLMTIDARGPEKYEQISMGQ